MKNATTYTLIYTVLLQFLATAVQPNVILIVSDDQGYGDYAFMGNKRLRTPALDQLASESVLFKRFYVNAVCSPTRASLMTGRSSYRTGVTDTWLGRSIMKTEEVTLAEVMKGAGYATAIFGKWHLGDSYPYRATDQGYDHSVIHLGGGLGQPSDHSLNDKRYTDAMLYRNNLPFKSSGFCTDVFFDEGQKWIKKQADANKPFFACIMPNAHHSPFHDVPPTEFEYYKNLDWSDHHGSAIDKVAAIYAMVENIDQNLARLRQSLRRWKLDENTILIYMSDNGGWGERFDNGLRGSKSSVFEGGIRSPLFVHIPGNKPSVNQTLSAHFDIMPTIMDLCDIKTELPNKLDGVSLKKALEKKKMPLRSIILQSHRGTVAERFNNCAVISDQWKLVYDKNDDKPMLFHLQNDASESHDLSSQHPERLKRLQQEYLKWFTSLEKDKIERDTFPCAIIGSDHEKHTILSRQDWRNMQGSGGWLGNDVNGEWLLKNQHTGHYHIAFRCKEKFTGKAQLNINDQVLKTAIDRRSAGLHIFESVFLNKGLNTVKINFPGKPAGPWKVEIQRAN